MINVKIFGDPRKLDKGQWRLSVTRTITIITTGTYNKALFSFSSQLTALYEQLMSTTILFKQNLFHIIITTEL